MPVFGKSPRVLPTAGGNAGSAALTDLAEAASDQMDRALDAMGEPFREELGDERFLEYKRIFRKIDADGSGAIDKDEIREALNEIGAAMNHKPSVSGKKKGGGGGGGGGGDASPALRIQKKITDEEIDQMMSAVDADGNGEIEFDEFLLMMQHQDNKHATEAAGQADLDVTERTWWQGWAPTEVVVDKSGTTASKRKSKRGAAKGNMSARGLGSARGGGDGGAAAASAAILAKAAASTPRSGGGGDNAPPARRLSPDEAREELSTAQVRTFKKIFAQISGAKTADGPPLSVKELRAGMKKMGSYATEEEVGLMVAQAVGVAADGVGDVTTLTLSFDDLLSAIASSGCDALRLWEEWWCWFPAARLEFKEGFGPDGAGGWGAGGTDCGGGGGGANGGGTNGRPVNPREVLELDQVSQFQQIFNDMDVNGDGGLSAIELHKMLGELGVNATRDDAQAMIDAADADGNGESSTHRR